MQESKQEVIKSVSVVKKGGNLPSVRTPLNLEDLVYFQFAILRNIIRETNHKINIICLQALANGNDFLKQFIFLRRGFHMWRLFYHYLFLISPSFGVSGKL